MPSPSLSHLCTLIHRVLLPRRPASHSTRESTWEAAADSFGSRSRPTGTVTGMDSWRATEGTGAHSKREVVSRSTEPRVREVEAGLHSSPIEQRPYHRGQPSQSAQRRQKLSPWEFWILKGMEATFPRVDMAKPEDEGWGPTAKWDEGWLVVST